MKKFLLSCLVCLFLVSCASQSGLNSGISQKNYKKFKKELVLIRKDCKRGNKS